MGPTNEVDYLAGQLGIVDVSCVKRYAERPATQWEHAAEIRDVLGLRDFTDEQANDDLRTFLASRAWTHAEGPLGLFGQAVGWLRRERVLLPGVSVLARLVSAVREAAAERLYRTLANAARTVDGELPARLRRLLEVPAGARVSELERLRRAPTRTSGPAMERALDRVAELAGLGTRAAEVSMVPANRLAMLARYGLSAKAPLLRELAEPRALPPCWPRCGSWRRRRSTTRWICSRC